MEIENDTMNLKCLTILFIVNNIIYNILFTYLHITFTYYIILHITYNIYIYLQYIIVNIIYYYSSSLPSPKGRNSGPASYGTEPAVPRASLGFAGLAQVLGNQLFQSWAIPLIGLLPPRGRAYSSYPINPWSWKCDLGAACPAPPGGGVVAPPMNLEKLG